MSPAKQVSFIERVSKSQLGLEGLQIVVYSDRSRNKDEKDIANKKYNFTRVGKQCLKEINGEYITNKYKVKEGLEFGKRLHQERVAWMQRRKNID